MAESKLRELSMEFSVDIINLVKYLKSNHESVIANQIVRSGTSIGANIHEAQYAQGKKEFIFKLEIPYETRLFAIFKVASFFSTYLKNEASLMTRFLFL